MPLLLARLQTETDAGLTFLTRWKAPLLGAGLEMETHVQMGDMACLARPAVDGCGMANLTCCKAPLLIAGLELETLYAVRARCTTEYRDTT